jgi:DNA-binding transcriptional LysR family regulator
MLAPTHLVTLRAVIESGSFALAAQRLNYTPSAVSQQMSALERACGLTLFERTAHSARPTAPAEWLADRAADLVAQLEELTHDVEALARGEVGRLRIGSFPSASARLLPGVLSRLASERPEVALQVEEGELAPIVARLRAGELDLAIGYRYGGTTPTWPASIAETPLLTEALWLIVPEHHRVGAADGVRLASLATERWIAPQEDTDGAANLVRMAAAADFVPQIAFRSNDYAVIHGLVAAGLGVAVIPELALVDRPGVRRIRLKGRSMRRDVLALSRRNSANPLVPVTIDEIRRAVRPHAAHPVRSARAG